MKKLRGSLTAKIIAIFLLAIITVGTLVCGFGAGTLAYGGAYTNANSFTRQEILESLTGEYAHSILTDYYAGIDIEDKYDETNIRFTITDENGKILISTYENEPSVCKIESTDSYYAYRTEKSKDYGITVYALENMQHEDRISIVMSLYDSAYSLRYTLIVFAVLGVLLNAILFVFLMCSAGHRDGSDEVVPNFIDRIPFDIFTAAIIALLLGGGAILSEIGDWQSALLAGVPVCILGGLLILLFFMSLATRLKLGGIIKGCLCYKVIAFCLKLAWKIVLYIVKALGSFFGFIRRSLDALPLLGKWSFAIAALLLTEFIFILSVGDSTGGQLIGWFFERAVLTVLALYAVCSMDKLYKGGRKLANGETDYRVDTKLLRGSFRTHGEDLNSMSLAASRAAQEQVKSERLRTELITNVSHDIKTPLTSIINYVDLLEKEKPENEKTKEYLDVLQRQSARLKKLIEDLLEASKASTGNIAVELQPCELGVLLEQTAGEYADKLKKAGVEPVLTKPDKPVTIMADGRHMWRILDNLMNNVCKYAMPGTRMYIDLSEQEGKAVMSFKNISAAPLNISSDELMERFVRGDASRKTEGSGLGLSIAKSLAQLQHGTLALQIDGDLFKATLTFDTAK